MTIELVDGKAGVAHISSEDKAIIHQAKFSKSDVVFDWGDAFKCTMGSANKATIGTGCASIQGLDWHITAAESVTISNGSQGMKRNDIICAHYHRDSKTGNELVELVVLKGTPNATAAADPTIPSGKILPGAVDAYMPLWRIPLDGITVGTPVRLFTPRCALWDSVPHCGLISTATDREGMVTADNPFRTTDGVFVLCQLCPNGMSDAAGKLFEAFFWDMTDSRLRFRIRRADNHEWVNDQQPVRVYWVAFKQQS
ncbi:hypothetical protein AAAX09_00375 [Bifidobacterium longum]|uniref:hypothetical protein n=1 Tax=Bifidobacterium longum TaxID=216816 RepID=UPI0032C0E17A